MPTHQPAAPCTSPLKLSQSLSGSLCALFSDADSGSGMKAELSPRPGVSEGALPSRLSSRLEAFISFIITPQLPSQFHFISQ